MSEGPIKQWRDAWKPARVSTRSTTSAHASGESGRAYCGRKGVAIAAVSSDVTCSDCLAALTADGREVRR